MRGTIQTGKIVPVDAPDFKGKAGMQGDQLAYVPTMVPAAKVTKGTAMTVDGVARLVAAVQPSAYVVGMQVVTLQPLQSV